MPIGRLEGMSHAAQISYKLGIGSRTALVRFALRAPVGNR
ncbi:protein of unknown function [Candidatus Methylomirabilis oxygeniifera]|uniref:Uncharacterized protein n=1 Tax=Methylomirabilis oxygeniifera TaxID=671143 RepID=D5MHC4_METO1|nr:protein of unknown function [Candidatus Methylomirabilis oxyfera]